MTINMRTIIYLILGLVLAGAIAWGMNHVLNIMVQKRELAPITEKSTWKQAGDDLEKYFEDILPEKLKAYFVGWTFYEFTTIAAGLLLIIIGLLLPSFWSIGFVAAGLALFAMRFQESFANGSYLIWLLAGVLALFLMRYKLNTR